MKIKNLFLCLSVIVLVLSFSSIVRAGTISGELGVWGGWTQFQDDPSRGGGIESEDWVSGNFVDPGYGGQEFDAEYLFYKRVGNTLFLGLQTGFDIEDGNQLYNGKMYYSGDVGLKINGIDYALDYGFSGGTYDNDLDPIGTQPDPAGIYENVSWGGDLIPAYSGSGPFAMVSGNFKTGINLVNTGSGKPNGTDTSYYRQISFDLTNFIQPGDDLWVDARWTMSCGNDAINGSIHEPVPEPATIALLGIGLAGFAAGAARRKWKKNAVDKS